MMKSSFVKSLPLLAILAIAVTLVGVAIAGGKSNGDPISSRTEKVSGSHIVSTVVVPVEMGGDKTVYCVISEDRVGSSNGDKLVALAQSCDFTSQ